MKKKVTRFYLYVIDGIRIAVLDRFYRWITHPLSNFWRGSAKIESSAEPTAILQNKLIFIDDATATSMGIETTRTILIVDSSYPSPDRDSGSLRMFGILSLLRDLGCRVLFLAIEGDNQNPYARGLEAAGIELVRAASPRERLRFWYASGMNFDAVILSRLPVASRFVRYARKYAVQARLIFDTVDLHYLRIAREAELSGDRRAARHARKIKREELKIVEAADTTWVVSEYEYAILHELLPHADIQMMSNVHEVHGRSAPFAARNGLLFLGNFQHQPNVDAAVYLVAEIMPSLRQCLPGVSLHIVGHAGDQVLQRLATSDVHVHGYVADLAPIFASVRLALAPLRYGAGVKGKINMAMSYGVPVVSTAVGVEGMKLVHRRDALIAEAPIDFATCTAELYNDAVLWLKLSDNGLENVRQHFSIAAAQHTLRNLIDTLPKH